MSERIQSMSDDECRRYYRQIRARSEADNAGVFDAAVKAKLAKWRKDLSKVTPQEWGVLKGPGGPCFRCKGKGKQNDHDVRRNEVHDQHYCPPGVI